VKGINTDKASFYLKRNEAIYLEYLENKQTMEQLAQKYNITKQRVWQIIRRCTLGEGDYYGGFKTFKDKEESLKELGIKGGRRHELLRKWMSENYEIKTIPLQREGE
jgi:predicted DNA-binding protein YlxM (UPF0122 family)|tara:strand:+ start:554 stop:874 length:321 start_codon:yes stop_codon:yes gene_type:complete